MRRVLRAAVVLGLVFAGCGGGGGGSDGDGGIEYTGLRTQVQVTAVNAQELAARAWGGQEFGKLGEVVVLPRGGRGAMSVQSYQGVPELVRRVKAVAEEALRGAAPRRAARTIEESGSDPGSCGGSMDWELRMDDETGSIEGSFSFEGFCEEGLTMDGDADVDGQADLVAGDIESLTIAFNELRMRGEGMDVSTSLTVVLETSDPDTVSTTLDLVFRDNLTSKTYWAEDYVTVATMEGDGMVMTLSGRWYDHDLGYVDVATAEPFRVGLFEEFPDSGVLVLNGAAGTRAVLTVLSSAECRVEADTDGNGVFEWDSGPVAWDDL